MEDLRSYRFDDVSDYKIKERRECKEEKKIVYEIKK